MQQCIADHYEAVVKAAHIKRDALQLNIPIIATGHLTVCHVTEAGSERDIYIGMLDAFPARLFPEVDYLALGHMHRAQCVSNSKHQWYSGAPIPLSFKELTYQQSVLMVTFQGASLHDVTAIEVPRFQPMQFIQGDLETIEASVHALHFTPSQPRLWLSLEIFIQHEQRLQVLERVESMVKDKPIPVAASKGAASCATFGFGASIAATITGYETS